MSRLGERGGIQSRRRRSRRGLPSSSLGICDSRLGGCISEGLDSSVGVVDIPSSAVKTFDMVVGVLIYA